MTFSPHINILVGDNGEGKTNLLEAIYLLGRGKSFRASREEELIQWKKDTYYLGGLVNSKEGERRLEIRLNRGGKEALIDGHRLDTLSQLGQYVNIVLFVPEDLKLVKGSPWWRRRFLDEEIGQIYAIYEEQLSRYQQVLKERNQYLKREKRDRELGAVLDEQLASYGSYIIKRRIQVIERLNPLSRLMNRRLSERKEELVLKYRSTLKVDRELKVDEIKDLFMDTIEQKRREEEFRGITLVGPHRDDMDIRVNKMNLREYGSQGQQRTTALALRLAQIELFKSERGEYPLILLDDVFSELDEKRCDRVMEFLQGRIQSFITTTSSSPWMVKGGECCIFVVKRGSIEEGV